MDRIIAAVVEQIASGALSREVGLTLLNVLRSNAPRPRPPEASREIAIVGMACRLPGVASLDEFWRALVDGRDLRRSFPQGRLDDVVRAKLALFERLGGRLAAQRHETDSGYFMETLDQFDAEFFGITPAEASLMDPRHRLFFETAWEAFENAGLTRNSLEHSRAGFYVAFNPTRSDEYWRLGDVENPVSLAANNPPNIAYRLAYWLNTHGPTLTVNTTCSSSLVAIHLARQALLTGDCDIAIAGGAYAPLLPPERRHVEFGIDAEDNCCRPFDAGASGTKFGEGFGVLILKRLSQAQGSRDPVHAIIKGSAIGSDGRTNGVMAPNPDAQADVILRAWQDAGVSGDSISFVEAHGTGTRLGDPIEVQGLATAFSRYTDRTGICAIGSVKANVGHTADAAGVIGLIKTVLAMKHRMIPSMPSFHAPNPLIPFDQTALYVNSTSEVWEEQEGRPLRAGVSSFGATGTNAHVVVESAPEPTPQVKTEDGPWILPISARSNGPLWELVAKYDAYFKSANVGTIGEICYSAACHRDHYKSRIAIIANSLDQLRLKVGRVASWRSFEQVPANFTSDGIFLGTISGGAPAEYKGDDGHLRQVASHYVVGTHINWYELYASSERRQTSLPTYPFRKQRHWVPLEVPNSDSVHALFHDLPWLKRPLEEATVRVDAPSKGTWLIFRDGIGVGDELRTGLKRQGYCVVSLSETTFFARLSDTDFAIRPAEEMDIDAAFAEIDAQGLPPLKGIIHLWTCASSVDEMDDERMLEASQRRGVLTLLSLSKVLLRRQERTEIQINYVTAYSKPVLGAAELVIPSRTTGAGLVRVLSQENPWIGAYSLDVDLSDRTPSEIGRSLLRELAIDRKGRETTVAYRAGSRYVQVLHPIDPSVLIPQGRSAGSAGLTGSRTSVKAGGTYVIAGGLGFLGIELGKHLSTMAAVKLVMINRSKLPLREHWDAIVADASCSGDLRRKLVGVLEMEKNGSQVLCLSADVTIATELKAALAAARAAFGPINGVIVAMKQLFHKRIDDISYGEFYAGLMNRVGGTWLLDRLSRSADRDFMVLISSISSVLGAQTACECCAVNQYLDSYGPYLRAQGMRANVLNFTLIRDGISEVVGESAIPAIESTEFLGAFDTAMRGDLGFSLVARFDPDQVRFLLPVIKIRFSDEMLQLLGISPVRMPDQAEAVARADVDVVMREAWNEVLGYPNPLPDHNFFDWGGTSLSILKLVRIVRERTAVPFDVTDVYESPTIGGMSLLIGQRQKGKHGFSVATAVAGKNDEEGLAKLLKEISTSPRLEIDDALAKYRALDR